MRVSEISRSGSQQPIGSILTKAEAAYVILRERILRGELAPGASLHQERLAADLGLSVTPLREALRRLEAEELVTLSAHKIVSVAPLSVRELHELCTTRERLDPFAATLAAQQATAQETGAIMALAVRQETLDPGTRLSVHREFHIAIYAASHNKVLAGILRQLWDRTDRYRTIMLRDHDDHGSGAEHAEIAKAIAAHHDATAADFMRRHVQGMLASIEKAATAGSFLGASEASN
jgi:DNA-binding GntR family transcriptional regulator